MEVPGHVGWSVTGDKTVEFARFPLDFVKKRVEKHNSKVFVSRALNKPTVFVTSSKGVKEILVDKCSSFRMGYKDFGYMQALYGNIFLFEDDEEAYKVRNLVKQLFHAHHCKSYLESITKITHEKLNTLHTCSSIDIYEIFKDLSSCICLSLFLDIDLHKDYTLIKEITKTHWHGLISVPVNVKVKGWSSAFSKAEEAKDHLITLILKKLEDEESSGKFLQCVAEAGFETDTEAANHILLFISSVIPKALSSMLTSFVLETAGDFREEMRERAVQNKDFLKDVLLEVQRLWPPLYGGRRYTTEPVVIDGYAIPADHAVAYITRFANRDPDVFRQADVFIPDRWKNEDQEKRNFVWTFGAGQRSCVGIHLIDCLVEHICTYLLTHYDWNVIGDVPPYKTLPVARPKETVFVAFTNKNEEVNGEKSD